MKNKNYNSEIDLSFTDESASDSEEETPKEKPTVLSSRVFHPKAASRIVFSGL